MARRRYYLTYRATSRNEVTAHRTKEAALKAAYDRLDLEQRDALALGDQHEADLVGKERGVMASSWSEVLRRRNVVAVYGHGRVTIKMERTDG